MRVAPITLVTFASLTSAHFTLEFPKARGFDEEKLGDFPCGSFDTPTRRTPWPIDGGQIALQMGHVQSNVEVFIGFGDDVGSAFNTVLRDVFLETGLGAFCMTGFSSPAGINIIDGTNATIQVVTNGDPDGGLYNCADIVFYSTVALAGTDVCKNGTGTSASDSTVAGFPNGTASTQDTSITPSPTPTATPSVTHDTMTITIGTPAATSPAGGESKSIPVGAIAGGTVAGVVGLAIIALLAFFLIRRHYKRKATASAPYNEVTGKAELPTDTEEKTNTTVQRKPVGSSMDMQVELHGQPHVSTGGMPADSNEMYVQTHGSLVGSPADSHELQNYPHAYEMHHQPRAHELHDQQRPQELHNQPWVTHEKG